MCDAVKSLYFLGILVYDYIMNIYAFLIPSLDKDTHSFSDTNPKIDARSSFAGKSSALSSS